MPRSGPLALKPFLISLLRETYEDKQENLIMADIRGLAADYSMRLDDIVSTLIVLTSEGGWHYLDDNGQPVAIADALLSGEARLSDEDIKKLNGSWCPAMVEG